MAVISIRTSRPDGWTPRQKIDPGLRRHRHGPIQPMVEDRGLLRRLFGH